jgi:hypothetical protein
LTPLVILNGVKVFFKKFPLIEEIHSLSQGGSRTAHGKQVPGVEIILQTLFQKSGAAFRDCLPKQAVWLTSHSQECGKFIQLSSKLTPFNGAF